MAKEHTAIQQALKELLKRSEQTRKGVQKNTSQKRDACALVLKCAPLIGIPPHMSSRTRPLRAPCTTFPRASMRATRQPSGAPTARRKHAKSCEDTVQKTVKKVKAVRARRLPLNDLRNQVIQMTDTIEKDLA